MDRKEQTGRERDMLNGIVALLLALADLAERAAGRSYPIRWLVLWYVRQAAAVAGDFVVGSPSHAAGKHWSPALAVTPRGVDAAAALHLAASLRALAVIVRDMAKRVFRLSFLWHARAAAGRSQEGGVTHGLGVVVQWSGTAPFSRVELSDTS